jgi:hypothetical protein
VHPVAGCVNQQRDLVLAKNGWQAALALRERDMVRQVWPSQSFHEEETQCRAALFDGAGGQFAVAKQMDLVRSDVLRPKLVGALPEVRRELLHGADVGSYGILGVIATLEFRPASFFEDGSHGSPVTPHTIAVKKSAGIDDA